MKKYLYGLRQAGYQWNVLLSQALIKHGYKRSQYDNCLFYKRDKKEFVIMTTHVDDFFVIASKQSLIDELYETLVDEFSEVSFKQDDVLGYLGIQIEKRGDEIFISQPGYVEKILEKVNIVVGPDQVAETPYTDKKYSEDKKKESKAVDKTVYLEYIGMLNYVATLTRPDLLYALSRCAQQCSNPTEDDLKKVIKIFKYLNYTKDYGIYFNRDKDIKLTCWVDASHACYPDGKGHCGYAFALGKNDGAFYCRSQKMKIVTVARSTETEYVALFEACTEIVFLRNLLEEIGFKQDEPTIVYEDNQSTINMAEGKGSFHKQKHINVKYHYTRELFKDGIIDVQYLSTDDMKADLLTKGLHGNKMEDLAKLLLNLYESED